MGKLEDLLDMIMSDNEDADVEIYIAKGDTEETPEKKTEEKTEQEAYREYVQVEDENLPF